VEVLKKVGGFNARYFMYHDDVDMSWLARLYGYKIYTEPKSVIYHKYNFSKNAGKFFWMERNRWWVIVKNYKLGTLIVFAPALIALEIMLLVYSLLGGWFGLKIKAYFSFWLGFSEMWHERKKLQQERVMSDKEFLKYVEHQIEFSGMTEGALIALLNKGSKLYFTLAKKIICW
jgi:GT2 family glycosyltransferase